MTQRKGQTIKQPARASTKAELATHIAAVLAHPDTPPALYNAIVDELCVWADAYLSAVEETAPYIESCLLYHERGRQEQAEGRVN